MKAIVIGATGLVGSALIEQLIEDPDYNKISILHRRATKFADPKIEETIVNFDKPLSFKEFILGDVLFSSLGTTINTAGSKEAQYKVDFEYQFEAAKMAAENGIPNYVLISSTGADSSSRVFYSKMKGELEEAIKKLSFNKIIILQPSILDGDRKESRLGERVGIAIGKLLSWVPGIRKYRPIHADIVARAMRHSVNNSPNGISVYKLEELFEL